VLAKGEQKHYQQQFSDIYFLRLAQLKPAVEELAAQAWDGYQVSPLTRSWFAGSSETNTAREDGRRHRS